MEQKTKEKPSLSSRSRCGGEKGKSIHVNQTSKQYDCKSDQGSPGRREGAGQTQGAHVRAHAQCVCVSLCPCVFVHTPACVRMRVCTCTCMSECMHTCLSGCEYTRASVPVCVCMHVGVCVRVHLCLRESVASSGLGGLLSVGPLDHWGGHRRQWGQVPVGLCVLGAAGRVRGHV